MNLLLFNTCDLPWESRAYVHKMHPFTLFHLTHLLCKLYQYCKYCIKFPIVCCTSCKISLMNYAKAQSYETSYSKNVIISCAHKLYFLMPGLHLWRYNNINVLSAYMKLINQIIFRNTNGFVTWLYTVYSVIIFSTNYVQVAYPVMSAK